MSIEITGYQAQQLSVLTHTKDVAFSTTDGFFSLLEFIQKQNFFISFQEHVEDRLGLDPFPDLLTPVALAVAVCDFIDYREAAGIPIIKPVKVDRYSVWFIPTPLGICDESLHPKRIAFGQPLGVAELCTKQCREDTDNQIKLTHGYYTCILEV